MRDTKMHKRSPLKQKPLRNPGESVQEDIQRVLEGQMLPLALLATLAIIVALDHWWRHFAPRPPQPIWATLIATVVVAYCGYRYVGLRKRLTSLQLGLAGEKTIGQFLEANRSKHSLVFHDIPCNGFNIDHVVIAPQGVFAIETKTFSKPLRGETVVEYDGERILVDGFEPDRNPITQARAVRNWLREFLHDSTRMDYPVKGVVLLPGWYVESPKDGRPIDIWVLNEKAFFKFVEHESVVLSDQDIAWASERLTAFVAR